MPSTPSPLSVLVLAWSVFARGRTGFWSGTILLLAVAGATGWLLTPGAKLQRLPGEESLGSPSPISYRATRDYEIRDLEATRELRAAAVAAERLVFDWDSGAGEEVADRVRDAFGQMREALVEHGARRDGGETARRAETAIELRRELEPVRIVFESRIGARVSAADFAALVDGRFSSDLEAALLDLVRIAFEGKVIEDRRQLGDPIERGIAVRPVKLVAGWRERITVESDQVKELASVRLEMERALARPRSGTTPAQRASIGRIAMALARPTLVFDLEETALRRRDAADRVKPAVIHVRRGQQVIAEGEGIERRHLLVLRGIREQTRGIEILLARFGGAVVVAFLLALLWRHSVRDERSFRPVRKDALFLAVAMLATGGVTALGLHAGDQLHDRIPRIPPEAFFHLVPFATGAVVIRSVLPPHVALSFAVASGALVGLIAGNSLFVAIYATLTSVVAVDLMTRTGRRAGILRIGMAVGLLGGGLVVATELLTGRTFRDAAAPALAALVAGGLLLPVFAAASLAIVERVFRYLTDVRLLELANLNHPALKDLIVQAPGTYHHSVVMGSLVEAAAEAIGANPLLARVCAYYHDLGKTRNPLLFGENQRGESKHDTLAPSMSALIVKRHVADGLELARHWRLPRAVADAIAQHHGTRRVSFFWEKARQEGNDAEALEEAIFRYPGPKPQTHEAALVMLADTCEASVRVLPDPTPDRIFALVRRRVQETFEEGQLDECDLTLRDLNVVTDVMSRALAKVYEGRSDTGDAERKDRPPGLASGPSLQVISGSAPRKS